MKISPIVLLVVLVSGGLTLLGSRPHPLERDLCNALSEATPGAEMEVELTGVLVRTQVSYFYDPGEPHCTFDVQPASWAEFASNAHTPPNLGKLLQRERQALVTLKGVMFGPRAPGPDDPTMSTMASFASRNAVRRYGNGGFRTRLLVKEVIKAESVPTDFGEPPELHHASRTRPTYEVVIPRYPESARHIGLQGDVVVRATVKDGRVTSARRLDGDRLFENSTLSAVSQWRTDPGVDDEFDIVFSFRLERRLRGSSSDPRIEAFPPHFIKITAAADGW